MSAKPPVSLRRKRSRVETPPSGGRRKTRTTRGLLAEIISRLPNATNNENTRRTMRKVRYGGPGIGKPPSLSRELYAEEHPAEFAGP